MTLAVYALVRLLFSFKRLRSTYLRREKIQRQQRQYPASFFFLSLLFLVTVVGNTLREEVPHVKDSLRVDSGFHSLDSRFQVLDSCLLVKFGFWIRIFSRVPDSLSCILDSKIQIPDFTRKNYLDFGIEISSTWSEKRRRLQSTP